MNIREAAVSGQFYDSDSESLLQQVHHFLGHDDDCAGYTPQALIVPHAGYIYSGQTAAQAYRLLRGRRREITRVVLFGPAHRVYLEGMAVPSADAFATPLGRVQLDLDSIRQLRQLPGVQLSDEAHRLEHSLEVQLPFLQAIIPDFALVPVVVGHCDPRTVGAAVDALWGGPETLLVISTDLSHFHTYDRAIAIDRATCERIIAKDNTLTGEDACGAFALNGLMSARHCAELEVTLLDSCNSGDTAGTRNRVVGYGAFILH